jgi:hypothetical protein
VHRGFWWENQREGDYWKDIGEDGKIILELIIWKCYGEAWTRLLWLRIGTRG